MNKGFMKSSICAVFLLALGITVSAGNNTAQINKLVRAEIAGNGLHTAQVVLEFAHPLFYEKKETEVGEQVEFSFPRIALADFERHRVVDKIRTMSMVRAVQLRTENYPIERVIISITFDKNKVLMRLTKMEDPNLLILDIYNKQTLDKIQKIDLSMLFACNDVLKPGETSLPSLSAISVFPCLNGGKKKSKKT